MLAPGALPRPAVANPIRQSCWHHAQRSSFRKVLQHAWSLRSHMLKVTPGAYAPFRCSVEWVTYFLWCILRKSVLGAAFANPDVDAVRLIPCRPVEINAGPVGQGKRAAAGTCRDFLFITAVPPEPHLLSPVVDALAVS
ncbi:hypothetical protein DR999_PMT12271 [Platysternon megacephalum]|uniref:Uncharacterized protein n=1 Tax=Platysternon megacephalum TaxID=55544 RepID=A0A4D9EBU8_9SAUR|nr:hypothetical protein DR999_PMT12271 [Platysternon megacephalum]